MSDLDTSSRPRTGCAQGWRGRRPTPTSNLVDGEPPVDGASSLLDVGSVRGDHAVLATQRSFGDGEVDGARQPRLSRHHADVARLVFVENLDGTAFQ